MKPKPNITIEDIGRVYLGENGTLYRLKEIIPAKAEQGVFQPIESPEPVLSGPLSDFADFVRLIPEKQVRAMKKPEEPKKPRKERKDKGTKRSLPEANEQVSPAGGKANPLPVDLERQKFDAKVKKNVAKAEKMAKHNDFRIDALKGTVTLADGDTYHEATLRQTVIMALSHEGVEPTRDAVVSYFGESDKVQEIMAVLGETS